MRSIAIFLLLTLAAACKDERVTWVWYAGSLNPLEPVPMAPPEKLERVDAPESAERPLRVQAERASQQAADPVDGEAVVSEPEPAQTTEPLPVDPNDESVATAQEATELEGDEALAAPIDPAPETPAIEVEQPAVNVAPVPWLDQYRAAYTDRRLALSDVTTAIADSRLGVYIEDHRAIGSELETPHMRWLGGRDLQVVSPSVEALMVGRNAELFGQTATFTCDASRYSCVSTTASTIGVYYRFAPLGSARAVHLVGVMYFDPSASAATTSRNIAAFDRMIDRELDLVE